ncbi:methyltransferase [Desulfoluna spongiiphila]|uniref:O-methyltransferase n=1 Tax=Desulfoluna spongiiphila TaxID=419481 RepID=A0A1G5AIT8_9BACT|nr:methyltransferase [Desulfoluna spongiiphila]SCX77818.1 O-methyltransferase [Desulfoluna spongiiphila]VVS90549.1 o-methyltransferase comt-type [Desulfoluna spongiiphila]
MGEMTPYLKFKSLLTGYRQYRLLEAAFDAGVFDIVGAGSVTAEALCGKVGWDVSFGSRALGALCVLGFLEETPQGFRLSRHGALFFGTGAPHPMAGTLVFEKRLFDAWELLGETLKTGERVYSATEKSEAEYKKDLAQYIEAMDEAARIRAEELWALVMPEKEAGRFVELGFGSGAYSLAFLDRHPGWSGSLADLDDVVGFFAEKKAHHPAFGRIGLSCVNLLEERWDLPGCEGADLLLLSNLVHCQGDDETLGIVRRAAALLAGGGTLVVHDFYRDRGEAGGLYDLHMMLNTYNGKAYTTGEMRAMVEAAGLVFAGDLSLPSGSCAVLARKM